MKRDLKGKRFQNVEELREKTTEALKVITLQEFQNCFEQWKKRCISVLILKERILRVIIFWKCSEKYTIKKKHSRYFWVPVVVLDFKQKHGFV
jgi:hypothetical protein